MCWTGDKGPDFLFREAEFAPYPCENGFASNRGKWHIYAVQCHTVQFLFPLFPSPVGHCVAVGADIHILPVFERGGDNLERAVGKFLRKADIVHCPGAQTHPVGCHIIIETPADSHCGAALDREFPILRFGAEIFSFGNRAGHF